MTRASSQRDSGRADDCTHVSASGVDTSDGPDKVWACDHCGLRWRQDGQPVSLAALPDRAAEPLERVRLDDAVSEFHEQNGMVTTIEQAGRWMRVYAELIDRAAFAGPHHDAQDAS